jgi:hypothetical protein
MAAMGGTARLHGGGVTGDRPELGSGGQGITAGCPEARGRIGELVPSLTGGWAAARRPGDETARWWSRVLGGGCASSSRRSLEWSGEGERDVENLPRWLMEHGTHQSVVAVAKLGERWPAGTHGSGEREEKNDGRGCGEDRGGEGAFYRPGWSIGEAVMASVGGQTRVL